MSDKDEDQFVVKSVEQFTWATVAWIAVPVVIIIGALVYDKL